MKNQLPLLVFFTLILNACAASRGIYTPENDEGSDATLGLENLPLAWAEASEDPNFKAAQDYISDQLYYLPAVKRAKKFNIKSDLGILCFYDTAIQHGVDGEEGLDNIISRLGRRSHYESEATYLNEFLKVRRGILMDPVDKSTRKVWQESVGRVDTLQAILLSKRLNQLAPMTISPFDESESYLIQRIEQP